MARFTAASDDHDNKSGPDGTAIGKGQSHQSITGSTIVAEPAAALDDGMEDNPELEHAEDGPDDKVTGAGGNMNAAGRAAAASSSSQSTVTGKRTATSRIPGFASSSVNTSPRISRDSSPARMTGIKTAKGLRSRNNSVDEKAKSSTAEKERSSRKGSVDDRSPSRNASAVAVMTAPSVPSAAAVQRALSAVNTSTIPHSLTANDNLVRVPKPRKSSDVDSGGDSTPHWPNSPRLKSPPPPLNTSNLRSSAPTNCKGEPSATSAPPTPSIVVQRSTPSSTSTITTSTAQISTPIDADWAEQASPAMMRSSGRGMSVPSSILETVQETGDAMNIAAPPSVRRGRLMHRSSEEERPEKITENATEDSYDSKGLRSAPESEAESSEIPDKTEGQKEDAAKIMTPADPASKVKSLGAIKSAATLAPQKSKTSNDGMTQSMTVETETVSSIPQVAVGGGAGDRSGAGRVDSGSVRLKRSTETIRPRKEKKKVPRKTPSLNSGTASSKADVFEAKVASAVDEANSSDSEETFVYESNPPDSYPVRPRHHSRTPSATSTVSLLPSTGGITRSAVPDSNHSVAGKRSMKFVHNLYNSSITDKEAPAGLNSPGLGRGTASRGGGASHHHHIGQWGRSGKNPSQHPSILDNDSPFPTGSRLAVTADGSTSRYSSTPSSPRHPHHHHRLAGLHTSKKIGQSPTPAYDIDVEGADDEGTPLIGSIRVNRSRFHRFPGGGSLRQAEYNETRQQRHFLRQSVGLVAISLMVLLVVSGAMGFLYATTEALADVRVHEIQNVLASEQEIMLDLLVEAVNRNIIAVTVTHMDVNVFAKSRHVGSASFRVDQHADRYPNDGAHFPTGPSRVGQALTNTGKDEGNDPIPDPIRDSQTMLLGRIFEFDSALTFDGAPFSRSPSVSIGEVRLAKPGNKTESGGTQRWERVIQHPFELIIRGVLKYQLPLSSLVHTAPIGASAMVHPEQGIDRLGRMTVGMLPPDLQGTNVVVTPKLHSTHLFEK